MNPDKIKSLTPEGYGGDFELTMEAELRTHNEYDSLLTKVLMEQHPEWSMEVVREAALICSNTLIPAVQQEIAKARINEGQMFREAMINHSTPAIYWGKRLDELSLKEHKE